MKDIIDYIETKNRKYPICFNLNVIEEIQDKYGSITNWGDVVEDKEKDSMNIKDLKIGLTIMINEAIDACNDSKEEKDKEPFVNEKQVGRIISEVGWEKITKIIMNLSINSTNTEDESKNV